MLYINLNQVGCQFCNKCIMNWSWKHKGAERFRQEAINHGIKLLNRRSCYLTFNSVISISFVFLCSTHKLVIYFTNTNNIKIQINAQKNLSYLKMKELILFFCSMLPVQVGNLKH